MRHAREKVADVDGLRAIKSYGRKRLAFAFVCECKNIIIVRWTIMVRHTSPIPFSLSSSRMMVRRFRKTIPGLFFNWFSRLSSTLTCVFGSTFLCAI